MPDDLLIDRLRLEEQTLGRADRLNQELEEESEHLRESLMLLSREYVEKAKQLVRISDGARSEHWTAIPEKWKGQEDEFIAACHFESLIDHIQFADEGVR